MIGVEAVAHVDAVLESIALSLDGIQICVCEPDPFLLDLLLRLFPVPLNLIPIHLALPNCREASSTGIKTMTHGISRSKPWLVAEATLEESSDVSEDETDALKHQRAADQGDAAAQYNLGNLYLEGRGMPQDDAKALKWFRRAADQGDAVNVAAVRGGFLTLWAAQRPLR
jgi:hypothetical protein